MAATIRGTNGALRRGRSDSQVTAHVTPTERVEFEAYGRKFGLDVGSLLNLLWVREMRVGSLSGNFSEFLKPDTGLETKVTAHLTDGALKDAIRGAAVKAELSVSRASAVLLRAELSARWLERAVTDGDSN